MPLSVLALPLAALGLAGAIGAVAGDTLRWYWNLAYGLGLGLGALALFRVYFLAAHAPLPRRRGFDPNRVRAAPSEMVLPPLLLGLISLGLAAALYSDRFQTFLDQRPHHLASPAYLVLWLGLPLAGALLAAVLFFALRPVGNLLAGAGASAWEGAVRLGRQALERGVVAPFLGLAGLFEDRALAGGESRLGEAVGDSARLFHRRLPLLPLALGLIVLAIVVAGLVAPGVYR